MKTLWLRCEDKPFERRTPLTPQGAKELISLGAKVIVEKCKDRIFDNTKYEAAGCEMVERGSWKEAPQSAFVLGLKELPNENFPLTHSHIFFAHAYKGQDGAQEILTRFKKGQGRLFDLEYLENEKGRRVAAFGYWAGYVGAATALWGYFNPELKLKTFATKDELINSIQSSIQSPLPKAIIVGAKGRCGNGASDLFKHFDIPTTLWDYEETKAGGPFQEISEHNIFVNTALITKKIPPFINETVINSSSEITMIADVSCDPTGELNPIPIYSENTIWDNPFLKKDINGKNLSILSVDNLPSVLPLESSEDFSEQLFSHIKDLITLEELPPVWEKSFQYFTDHIEKI